MGKIKQGILGGFNGTTGTVVGASWKGIAYMRGKAQSIANPRTQSQTANRDKFGTISDILSKIKSVINDGFKSKAVKQSAFNAAVKANMAIPGEFSMTTLKIAEGNLVAPISGEISGVAASSLVLTVKFPYMPADDMDIRYCLLMETTVDGVFVPVTGAAVSQEGRIEYELNVILPTGLQYQRIYAYAYLGDHLSSEVSDSSFLTEYTPS